MIKQLSILFTIILFVSCSKNETALIPEAPKTSVSFTYNSYRDAFTRASATEAEKAVFDMDIFICSGNQFIRKLIPGSDYKETDNGNNSILELTPEFITEFEGCKLVFYFVANNTCSTGGKHVDTDSFTGSATDFENLTTAALKDSPWHDDGSKAELISTYDDFNDITYGLLMSAKSSEITMLGKHTEHLELKRRTARFDIQNMGSSQYRVQYIYVYGAREKATVFSTASINASSFGKRDLERIIGPTGKNYTETDEKGEKNIAPAVFYLYPTNLISTTIVAEVKDMSKDPAVTATFELKTDGLTNKTISANKRYIIYFDEEGLGTIGDWEEGGRVNREW